MSQSKFWINFKSLAELHPNWSSIISAKASSRAAHLSDFGARRPTRREASGILSTRWTHALPMDHLSTPSPEWISHVLFTFRDLTFGHENQAASEKSKLLDEECPSWLLVYFIYTFVEWIYKDKSVHED